jgi:NADH-quinone oxidoreductase subunit C
MTAQEIHDLLKSQFADAVLEAKLENVPDPFAKVQSAKMLEIAQFVKNDERLQFDYLMCLSGVDYKGKLGVTYHLHSMVHKHKFVLKVEVPTETPDVPSVESVWKTANWHEREAFDLYGLNFVGHPDLRRILLPNDWVGYPLRKDYQTPEYYNGMKVPY